MESTDICLKINEINIIDDFLHDKNEGLYILASEFSYI